MKYLLNVLSFLIQAISTFGRGILNESGSTHNFNFQGENFADHLEQSKGPENFFYLLMGDSQFWFRCTRENIQCFVATKFCDVRTEACQVLQGNYANKLQEKSLRALILQMAARNIRPKGLIINGDLTDYGHRDELQEYKNRWETRLEGIRVYPGLGNHDYQNNVDDCTVNHCANRMLEYFKNFVRTKLIRPIDLRQDRDFFTITYTGSLAYSWDECALSFAANGSLLPQNRRKCIHFVQLNNYPTYERKIQGLVADWQIKNSLDYLRADLYQNRNRPVIINFHNYDYYDSILAFQEKQRFHSLISDPQFTVLAVFFAHVHSKIGLHPTSHLCVDGRSIPLIYTGSVPANNYMLIGLNPGNFRQLVAVYKFHVNSEQDTTVQQIHLPNSC